MKYKPFARTIDEPTEFWCHCCDRVAVHSEKPETGTFYQQWGHTMAARIKGGVIYPTDEYEPVLFALCPECDPFK